jgi:hypothetical protein
MRKRANVAQEHSLVVPKENDDPMIEVRGVLSELRGMMTVRAIS